MLVEFDDFDSDNEKIAINPFNVISILTSRAKTSGTEIWFNGGPHCHVKQSYDEVMKILINYYQEQTRVIEDDEPYPN